MTKIWEQGNENVAYTVISPSSNSGWVYNMTPEVNAKQTGFKSKSRLKTRSFF